MIENEISRQLINHSANKLSYLLSLDDQRDQELVKAGLKLFREGNVYNAKADEDLVDVTVLDYSPYHVTLNLDFFEMSECECAASGICRHQLAAFFYLYNSFDSPTELIQQWKQTRRTELAGSHRKKAATPAMKPSQQQHDLDAKDIAQWWNYFQTEYDQFIKTPPRQSWYFSYQVDLEDLFHKYYPSLLKKKFLEPTTTLLYQIHAGVDAFLRIITFSSKDAFSYYRQSYRQPFLHEIIENVSDLLSSREMEQLIKLKPELLEQSLPFFEKLLVASNEYETERINLYRLLLFYFVDTTDTQLPAKVDEVIMPRIRSMLTAAEEIENQFSVEHNLALAHFGFLLKKDVLPFEVLKLMNSFALQASVQWLEFIVMEKDWQRLKIWIDFLQELLLENLQKRGNPYKQGQLVSELLQYHRILAMHTEPSEDYFQALRSLLPHSYAEFSQFYLETEDYRGWTELQIWMGIEPRNFSRNDLKVIEAAGTEYLIPFYHFGVEQEIGLKNRNSYKQAVKYLKKLRTLYRKEKHQERFDEYLEHLLVKYKRLRAFKQELTRGKLIND